MHRARSAEGGWSVVLPTYRRPEMLASCMGCLAAVASRSRIVEILVFDNGAPQTSESVVARFQDLLPISYILNEPGHGLGYSLSQGAKRVVGDYVLELNDDALVPPDVFERIERVFQSDAAIGIVGVRAMEEGSKDNGEGIGRIDAVTGEIVGNFHLRTDEVIDVEHVYGFCYAYRRELLDRGASHDSVLLAQDYSTGDRLETDHCLMARKLGYRVVYDGRIAVQHLAMPRGDMSERSPRWRSSSLRNTLYLYLKHFGWFGRGGIAFRLCCFRDVGLRSALLQPSRANWDYFFSGVRARASAIIHWLKYLGSRPRLNPMRPME